MKNKTKYYVIIAAAGEEAVACAATNQTKKIQEAKLSKAGYITIGCYSCKSEYEAARIEMDLNIGFSHDRKVRLMRDKGRKFVSFLNESEDYLYCPVGMIINEDDDLKSVIGNRTYSHMTVHETFDDMQRWIHNWIESLMDYPEEFDDECDQYITGPGIDMDDYIAGYDTGLEEWMINHDVNQTGRELLKEFYA